MRKVNKPESHRQLSFGNKNETGLFSPVSKASRCEAVTSQHGAAGPGSCGRDWRPFVDPAPANVKGARMQTVRIEQLTGHVYDCR